MTRFKATVFVCGFVLFVGCSAPPDTGVSDGGLRDGGGLDAGSIDAGAIAPTVTSVTPESSATNVAVNARISATFSKPMRVSSLSEVSMTLKQGAVPVTGVVTYAGSTATFTPTNHLAANTVFTATLSTAVTDVDGLKLETPFVWAFTTGATTSLGPAPVGLGLAGTYVVLAKTSISTVPASMLTGDVGLSPAAATFVTGFSLVAESTNVFSTATQVVGRVYAANYAVPTPERLTTAISNMESAYTDAAGRPTPDFLELGTGAIGGLTLAPGLYKWTSAITIDSNVIIEGGVNDVWVFQTSGDLSMTAGKVVTLRGGAQAQNIFWQTAGKVTLGANSHFEGVVLSKTEITLQTGATMNGRALAQSQVVLQQATLTQPSL
jgi:hypothetical protein